MSHALVEMTVELAAPLADPGAPESVVADRRVDVITGVIGEALARTHLLEAGFVRITTHPMGDGRLVVEVSPVRFGHLGERPVTVLVRVSLPASTSEDDLLPRDVLAAQQCIEPAP